MYEVSLLCADMNLMPLTQYVYCYDILHVVCII